MRKGAVFAGIILFALNGFIPRSAFAKLSYDGEIRNRFVYFANKDLDSSRAMDFGIIDLRGRLGLKLTTESPFYAYYKLEIGNIAWGEDALGGSLTADAVNIETKNLFIGYGKRQDPLRVQMGLIDFATPLGAEVDDSLAGLKINLSHNFSQDTNKKIEITGELLYSLLFAGSNELVPNNEIDDFELSNLDDTQLIYAGAGFCYRDRTAKIDEQADIWFLGLDDKRYVYKYFSGWLGLYNQFDFRNLKTDVGFSYNLGNVTNTGPLIPIQAFYLYGQVKWDVFSLFEVSGRYHYATGHNGETNVIRQFQSIRERGKLKTDLGILFGGSSFNQQCYFDNRVIGVDTRRNLTKGALRFTEAGLSVLEIGVSREFKPLGWETMLVFGYARTAQPLEGNSLLGLEFDWHNQLKLADDVKFNLSVAALIPGKALQSAYSVYRSTQLGGAPAFKIDGQWEIAVDSGKKKDKKAKSEKKPAIEIEQDNFIDTDSDGE